MANLLAYLPGDIWRTLGAGGPIWRAVAVILIVGVVTIGSSVGVVQAADETLPDHPLYPVKTAREWVEERIARDGEARSLLLARQSARRAVELSRVVEAGKPRLVAEMASARVQNTVRRLVVQAIEQREKGNPRPAQRALTVVQSLRQQVERANDNAHPRYRTTLSSLSKTLGEEERVLTTGESGSAVPSGLDLPGRPRYLERPRLPIRRPDAKL
jgi:hypothetical protein